TKLRILVLSVLEITLGSAWLKKEIHLQTNIFALLPKATQDPRLERAQQYVSQQWNDKVFVVLNAKDDVALAKAITTFKQSMAESDLWQPLNAQLDSDKFAQVLYQHRASFLTVDDQKLLQQQDYASLTDQGLLQIMSPGMPVTAELLQQDPLLLFPRYAMGLSSLQSNADIALEDGFATIRDDQGISRLLVLELKNSPYNIDYQQKTAIWIERLDSQLRQLQVQPHWTGTLLFAQFGTTSAEKEISTIGLGSTL